MLLPSAGRTLWTAGKRGAMTGSTVALTGPSGCGKRARPGIPGSLDRPACGTVHIEGTGLWPRRPLHRVRAGFPGMFFQFHHLLPAMTLVENVETP
jgi:putative ABC transport system ATP-binding protein